MKNQEDNWEHICKMAVRLMCSICVKLQCYNEQHQMPTCTSCVQLNTDDGTDINVMLGWHALCQHGPTGSSEEANYNWRPVVFYRWTTSVEQPICYTMGDGERGHWLVWMEWRPAGWSLCLPLLIFSCTIKSRSSLRAPAHLGGPGKRAVKQLWCGVCNTNSSLCSTKLLKVFLFI